MVVVDSSVKGGCGEHNVGSGYVNEKEKSYMGAITPSPPRPPLVGEVVGGQFLAFCSGFVAKKTHVLPHCGHRPGYTLNSSCCRRCSTGNNEPERGRQ